MQDITQSLISMGLPRETIFLLLMLPFVSFIIAFFRQIVGIKTFGLYEPIVVSFALFAISPNFSTGLKYGLPILFISWLVGEITRRILSLARLHYIAKVSLKLSIACVFVLGFLIGAAYWGKTGIFTVNPIAIIIILTLVESISLFQIKKGDTYTNLVSIETLIVSAFSYYLISSPLIRDFMLERPYFVILPILGNLVVGRWTGFRLSEYIRFKDVLKND